MEAVVLFDLLSLLNGILGHALLAFKGFVDQLIFLLHSVRHPDDLLFE